MEFPGEKPAWGILHIVAGSILIFVLMVIYGQFLRTDLFDYLFFLYGYPATDVQEFFLDYAVQLIVTLSTVLIILFVSRSSLKDLGFVRQNMRHGVVLGILWGVAIYAAVIISYWILKSIFPNIPPQSPEVVLKQAGQSSAAIGLFIYIAVLGPLSEEVFYRGMIYPVFRRYLGVGWGIVTSGIIFGAVHGDKWRLFPLVLGGIALAHIYEKSKTIYAPWIAHGVWNGIMAITTIYLS
ncbi:MAG: type II CAAX prenyl endopeptidase Rce1 family protein [Acidobacteriota bacterium]